MEIGMRLIFTLESKAAAPQATDQFLLFSGRNYSAFYPQLMLIECKTWLHFTG